MGINISRITSSIKSNTYNQIIGIISNLLMIPVFLHFWTSAEYGEWLILTTLPSYLSLVDGGLCNIIGNHVILIKNDNNLNFIRNIINTTFYYLIVIILIFSTFAYIFIHNIKWDRFLNLIHNTHDQNIIALNLLTLYCSINIITNIFIIIYRYNDSYNRFIYIQSTSKAFEIFTTLLAVSFTHIYFKIVILLVVVRILTFIFFYFDTKNYTIRLIPNIKNIRYNFIKGYFPVSTIFTINTLSSAIYIEGIILIVGANLGTSALSVLNVTRTIMRGILVQFSIFVRNILQPEYAISIKNGNNQNFISYNYKIYKYYLIVSNFLAIILYCFGLNIIKYWTSNKIQPDKFLINTMLLTGILNNIWYYHTGLINGLNLQHKALKYQVVALIFSIYLIYIFIPIYKLWSIPIGMSIYEVIMIIFIFKFMSIYRSKNV
jgi:O-antigen/teichoic acid export membrane protein